MCIRDSTVGAPPGFEAITVPTAPPPRVEPAAPTQAHVTFAEPLPRVEAGPATEQDEEAPLPRVEAPPKNKEPLPSSLKANPRFIAAASNREETYTDATKNAGQRRRQNSKKKKQQEEAAQEAAKTKLRAATKASAAKEAKQRQQAAKEASETARATARTTTPTTRDGPTH